MLELVHMDVIRPMKTKSKGAAKYVLTFVDEYSRYVIAYFPKSEISRRFESFKTMYKNQ